MSAQQPAKQRGPAAFGLKKVLAWLHRRPLTADLLLVVGLAMVVISEALR